MKGPSPKTRRFIEDLVEHADNATLEHLVKVAEREAEDALEQGDIDRHMSYGLCFHLIRGEKERRNTVDGTSCHLEPPMLDQGE